MLVDFQLSLKESGLGNQPNLENIGESHGIKGAFILTEQESENPDHSENY